MTIRSTKYLRGAKGQGCINCGANNGTIVAAHYTGLRSSIFGKGTGCKPHDVCVADLCRKCHETFDKNMAGHGPTKYWKKIDASEQFMYCVVQTFIRRLRQGIITLEDMEEG